MDIFVFMISTSLIVLFYILVLRLLNEVVNGKIDDEYLENSSDEKMDSENASDL